MTISILSPHLFTTLRPVHNRCCDSLRHHALSPLPRTSPADHAHKLSAIFPAIRLCATRREDSSKVCRGDFLHAHRLSVGDQVQPLDGAYQNCPVARFWKTPTDKSEIALLGQSRQTLQLGVHFALFQDPIPQPSAIKPDNVCPLSIHTDFERIAEQTWSTDVNPFVSMRLFIFYRDHTFLLSPFTNSKNL